MNREIDAYMHKFSKAITADGQLFPDQTNVKSGHNISYVEVRAEEIPICNSIEERNTSLLTSDAPGYRKVKDTDLQKIIKFYDRVPLTCLINTNGEAWVLLDENNIPIKGFIDPTDRLVDGRKVSDGYKVIMYAEDGTRISPHQGWTFESFSGLFKFDSDKTPEKMGWGTPRVEVFRYVGKTVKEKFGDITQLIESIYNNAISISKSALVVQPFDISTEKMIQISESPYLVPGTFDKFGKQVYANSFQYNIPGYVFEAIALDKNETIIPECQHLENGDSNVTVEVAVDPESGLPIIGYEQTTDSNGFPLLSLKVGHLNFRFSTFMTEGGEKIKIKPVITLGQNNVRNNATPLSKETREKMESTQFRVNFKPTIIE